MGKSPAKNAGHIGNQNSSANSKNNGLKREFQNSSESKKAKKRLKIEEQVKCEDHKQKLFKENLSDSDDSQKSGSLGDNTEDDLDDKRDSKIDSSIELFQRSEEFRKLKKTIKKRQLKIFLQRIQEEVFAESQNQNEEEEEEFHEEKQNKRQNKAKNKLLKPKALESNQKKEKPLPANISIFEPNRANNECKYSNLVNSILNEKINNTEVLRHFQKIVASSLQKDFRIFEKAKNEYYKTFTDEINKQTDVLPIFNHAIKFNQIDVTLQCLFHMWKIIEKQDETNINSCCKSFIDNYFLQKFANKSQQHQWYQITKDQAWVLLNILSREQQFRINDVQADYIGKLIKLNDSDDQEDHFITIFMRQHRELKAIGFASAFGLEPLVSELVCSNLDEFYSPNMLQILEQIPITKAQVEIIKKISGFKKDSRRLNNVIGWLNFDLTKDIISQILKGQQRILYDALSQSLCKLQNMYRDQEFVSHIQSHVASIQSLNEIETIINNFRNTKAEMRGDGSIENVQNIIKNVMEVIQRKQDKNYKDTQFLKRSDCNYAFKILSQEKKFHLYEWQKLIVCFTRFIQSDLNLNAAIELGTGHGKTAIIAALSHVIAQDKQTVVLVVTMNSFLTQYAFESFRIENNTKLFPQIANNNQILYISHQEILTFPEEYFLNKVIIFDEIDQCFIESTSTFIQDENDEKKYQIKFPPMVFSKSKTIIGFTGTLSDSTMEQISSFHSKQFEKLRVSLVVEKPQNSISKKSTFSSSLNGDRNKKILEAVQSILKQKHSAIVIDEQLAEQSFLETKLGGEKVSVINDFDEDSFANTNKQIKDLELKKTPHVIHTTLQGVRGVDFKLQGEVDVVIAFHPNNYFDVLQALGRGTRDFLKSSSGHLILDKDKDIQIEPGELLKYFKDQQSTDDKGESLRVMVMTQNHGKQVENLLEEDVLKAVSIFRNREPIYYQKETAKNKAVQNWQLLRKVFPPGSLTKNPIEMYHQQQIQRISPAKK